MCQKFLGNSVELSVKKTLTTQHPRTIIMKKLIRLWDVY